MIRSVSLWVLPLLQYTRAALLEGMLTTPIDETHAALQTAAHENNVKIFQHHLSQGADVHARNSAVSEVFMCHNLHCCNTGSIRQDCSFGVLQGFTCIMG